MFINKKEFDWFYVFLSLKFTRSFFFYMDVRYTFCVKSQHSKKFVWPLFLGFRSFDWYIFCKFYQLKGLKPKYKSHTNFYECCDLTKKVYLMASYMAATSAIILLLYVWDEKSTLGWWWLIAIHPKRLTPNTHVTMTSDSSDTPTPPTTTRYSIAKHTLHFTTRI